MADSETKIQIHATYLTRTYLNAAVIEYGTANISKLMETWARAHHEGRLIVLDRVTKEALVGAAEEKMLVKAAKAGRTASFLALYEEGYRPDPYDR